MDASNELRSNASNGAAFTDILTVGELNGFLEAQCVANGLPRGSLTSPHTFTPMVACRAEMELLPDEQLENLGMRVTSCGFPANAVDGQYTLSRPFARNEMKCILRNKVHTLKDATFEHDIRNDIESWHGGESSDGETDMNSMPAAQSLEASHFEGAGVHQLRAHGASIREMCDLTAMTENYHAATGALWRLAGRFPSLTSVLEGMYGPTVEPDQRSIVLPDAMRIHIEFQSRAAKLLRLILKNTELRAVGGAPWLTSLIAELDEAVIDHTLAREVSEKRIEPALSKYQLVYGGFSEGFLMAELLRASWSKIVTTSGEALVSAFRQLTFAGPSGALDAAGASNRITLLIADAKRNYTPIDYERLVRVVVC